MRLEAPGITAAEEPHLDRTPTIANGACLRSRRLRGGRAAPRASLALALSGQGLDVWLARIRQARVQGPPTQALYEGEVTRRAFAQPPGPVPATHAWAAPPRFWGGRCVPFDPIDFEARDQVPHSGWPISYADLLPFYPRPTRCAKPASTSTRRRNAGLQGRDDRRRLQRAVADRTGSSASAALRTSAGATAHGSRPPRTCACCCTRAA